jgi:hypothetical protein
MKFQPNLWAASLPTRDLPVPEKPVMIKLVIRLSISIMDILRQYIEKARLEQGLAPHRLTTGH